MWRVQFRMPNTVAPVVVPFSQAKQAYIYYHYQARVGGYAWLELVNPEGKVVLSA